MSDLIATIARTMAREVIPHLPPRAEYSDWPPLHHNNDNVQVRTLCAAWNALFHQELTEFSFIAFAREVGVSPCALYRYYPSISSLAADLAAAALACLHNELVLGFPKDLDEVAKIPSRDFVLQVARNYLAFATKRPRHFSLAVSKQYAAYPGVAAEHARMRKILSGVLRADLRRDPTDDEVHDFWALLHGSALLVASGQPPRTEHTLWTLARYFDALRAA